VFPPSSFTAVAFTLIELLVAVAIIDLLLALSLLRSPHGGTGPVESPVPGNLRATSQALHLYKTRIGRLALYWWLRSPKCSPHFLASGRPPVLSPPYQTGRISADLTEALVARLAGRSRALYCRPASTAIPTAPSPIDQKGEWQVHPDWRSGHNLYMYLVGINYDHLTPHSPGTVNLPSIPQGISRAAPQSRQSPHGADRRPHRGTRPPNRYIAENTNARAGGSSSPAERSSGGPGHV
jgi:hypothetical protein